MLTWYDAEESVEVAQMEAAAAEGNARWMLEIEDLEEENRVPLRRRIANAFVQLGVKIDAAAAEALGVSEDAA